MDADHRILRTERGWHRVTLSRRTIRAHDGFALLLAVTLLALVMFLLLALAATTRVETSIARTTVRLAQARELALVAHRMALDQLQSFAGPDQRVTATGAAGATSEYTRHWTGVWNTAGVSTEPMTWLVSGDGGVSEPALSDYALPTVELVGRQTSGLAGAVQAPLVEFAAAAKSEGVAPELLGRYAWWIGDQGVKAPVAAGGGWGEGAYPPDQPGAIPPPPISFGPGAADAAGQPVFEILDAANARLTRNVISFPQLAFLHGIEGDQLGVGTLRAHFHAWSANNHAVLSDTTRGGLRADLSLRPDLLGPAFEAWCNPARYLESPAVIDPAVPPISPPYGHPPLRRRHRILPPIAAGGIVFTNAPVLASFFLQFNVRRVGGNAAPATTTALEVRARMVTQLWNPWTSAIIPEPLRLEVTGLPPLTISDSNGGRQIVSLAALFGNPMRIELEAEDRAFPGDPDDQSWLPGRVYAWRSRGGDAAGWRTEFYHRTLSVPNAAVWTVAAGIAYTPPAANGVQVAVSGADCQLALTLRRIDGAELWQVQSPPYAAFATTPQRVNQNDEYRFGFPIRLVDPVDFAAAASEDGGWLTATGVDPRATSVGEPLYRTGSGGDLPSAYVGVGGNSVLTDENRLLDRVMGRTGMSYNEDVPVFELPRFAPVSLGQLQHLQVEGARAFGIGNPWGAAAMIQGRSSLELFDRYFFSGEITDPNVADESHDVQAVLAARGLRLLPRDPATRERIRAPDFQAAPGGISSQHLLQSGAFNLNSTDPLAWAAVLRSSRLTLQHRFAYLDASALTGSAPDDAMLEHAGTGAIFRRFSQSGAETYKSDPGYAATIATPPAEPAIASLANSHLYRRGIRVLTTEQLAALSAAIASLIAERQRASGPFRSIAEFLGSDPHLGNRSVFERAIETAGINTGITEFSSQWLTPADLMTTLAPILFARSDTFLIRSYGEATNPATGATEARAWCEATVQRFPEYHDAVQDPPTAAPGELTSARNRALGRRFKVVSFRWLSSSDI